MDTSQYEIKSLVLSSQFKSNGTVSNPSFILSEQLNNVKGVKLKNASIPISFYTFDSRNNKIYFTESGQSATSCTIPTGIYTSTTLPAALKTALDAASVTAVHTVTYSSTSNKITYSSTVAFQFNDGINNAYYELGINSSNLSVSATSHTPNEVIDLSGVNIIHIASNIPSIKVVNKPYNIIGSINVEAQQNSVNAFKDDSNDYIDLDISNVGEISFFLLDARFRRLTALKDYSITLNFLTN